MSEKKTLKYEPLHPEIYSFSWDVIEDELASALKEGTKEALLKVIEMKIIGR